MRNRRPLLFIVSGVVIVLIIMLIATRDPTNDTVHIKFTEYALTPQNLHLHPGKVQFDVANMGMATHDLTVIRAPSIASLKIEPNGTVEDEELDLSRHMGATGEIEPGHSTTKLYNLPKGTYVMFCTVVENDANGKALGHFRLGEHSLITVR